MVKPVGIGIGARDGPLPRPPLNNLSVAEAQAGRRDEAETARRRAGELGEVAFGL